ncbi:hypothetical protein Cadr_000010101 [Camelus dromedarius]|uniref:Uncharacterized protein n=1 Tax=Camelus dromedarius TaxID=9838 RepID=A0A5N4DVM6_CAMDR|nr:hypothetical protein Cadr_000010101 [Camelus dromedarius]
MAVSVPAVRLVIARLLRSSVCHCPAKESQAEASLTRLVFRRRHLRRLDEGATKSWLRSSHLTPTRTRTPRVSLDHQCISRQRQRQGRDFSPSALKREQSRKPKNTRLAGNLHKMYPGA